MKVIKSVSFLLSIGLTYFPVALDCEPFEAMLAPLDIRTQAGYQKSAIVLCVLDLFSSRE